MKPVSAKLTALVHATEDTRKVSRALDQVCPVLMFEQKSETRKFKGHFGNEITTLTLSLRKRSTGPFLQCLLKLFSTEEQVTLKGDIENRIDDDGHFYLRLDKQECFLGNFRLVDQDPIKCEFSFEIANSVRDTPRDQVKRFLSSMLDPG